MDPIRRTSTPSVSDAIEQAYGAGQRLVVDRIDLLALQAAETWGDLTRGGSFAVAGGVVTALGWCCVVGALLAWLGPMWSWPLALALVGALHLAAGLALVAAARASTAPTGAGR
ncbi:MAG: phage holin family protein [Deltaproteobacteria bacterium]|nr:phage holin family protein [Deltaproteobacteria bacterium]